MKHIIMLWKCYVTILCFLSPPLQPRVIFSKSYFKWEPNFCKRTVTHRYSGNCSIVNTLIFISIRSVMAVHFTVVLYTLSSKYNQRLYWLSLAMEQQLQDRGGHGKYCVCNSAEGYLGVSWATLLPAVDLTGLGFSPYYGLGSAELHTWTFWSSRGATWRKLLCVWQKRKQASQGHEDSAVPCLCWAE